LPWAVDPLASTEKQESQPDQKGGGELRRNGGDRDQGACCGYDVSPVIGFE